MIPVQGYTGQIVAVLGLGRSGRAAALALREGGAQVVVWDDGQTARDAAQVDGFALRDLAKVASFEGVAALIVSPGIPHLYPSPHPAVAAAWDAGVPVDNDIGLFFRSFATDDWDGFDTPPPRHRGDRIKRQIHDRRLDPPHPSGKWPARAIGGQYRARRAGHRPGP